MPGFIIMLAVGAIYAEKFSKKQYAPELIRTGCLIGMTVLFFSAL